MFSLGIFAAHIIADLGEGGSDDVVSNLGFWLVGHALITQELPSKKKGRITRIRPPDKTISGFAVCLSERVVHTNRVATAKDVVHAVDAGTNASTTNGRSGYVGFTIQQVVDVGEHFHILLFAY